MLTDTALFWVAMAGTAGPLLVAWIAFAIITRRDGDE